MLRVSIPSCRLAEAAWVCNVVFEEFLGIAAEQIVTNDTCFRVNGEGKELRLPNLFFESADFAWTKPGSLPSSTLASWHGDRLDLEMPLISDSVPILFGNSSLTLSENAVHLGLDIFGSLFFMLSRYEEVTICDRDAHDRFPAAASIAHRNGFLERPIVDEYVEILWACMKRLWPGMKRKPRVPRVFVTCDVDQPYDYSLNTPLRAFRRIAGDLIKRRSVHEACGSLRNALARGKGDWSLDPNNTFDWMMDACERAGHQAAYFFIAGRSSTLDGEYELGGPFIQCLLSKIHRRGHEVGLHGSYNSYRDPSLLTRERRALAAACDTARVDQRIVGNRQHYLRWDSARSPGSLEEAELEYDTSGSFADAPGFRYGTAHSFSMWDWQKGRPSKVRQRPLIMMETSVMAPMYQALGPTEAALEKMLELKRQALRYGGEFVLLWHNSSLVSEVDRRMFSRLLGVGSDKN
jgi:hypothetical protein